MYVKNNFNTWNIVNGSIRKKVLCTNSFLNKKYKTTKTIAIFINGKKDIGAKQIFIISKGKEIRIGTEGKSLRLEAFKIEIE